MVLMLAGLLGKGGRALGQMMEVRGPDSAGFASKGLHWQGIGGTVFQDGCVPTGLYGKQDALGVPQDSSGPKG